MQILWKFIYFQNKHAPELNIFNVITNYGKN